MRIPEFLEKYNRYLTNRDLKLFEYIIEIGLKDKILLNVFHYDTKPVRVDCYFDVREYSDVSDFDLKFNLSFYINELKN